MLRWRRKETFQPDCALDLGSRQARLAGLQGEPFCQANAVLWDLSRNRCLFAGEEAEQRTGRHPRHQSMVRPIEAGLLADFDAAEQLCRALLTAWRPRAQVLLAAPALAGDMELQILAEMVREAGAAGVCVVPASLGLARSCALPILETSALAVVDAGHELWQASIYSRGCAVLHRQRAGGGADLERRLGEHFLRRHWLEVGVGELRSLVTQLRCPAPEDASGSREEDIWLRVRGRDLQSGLPRTFMASRWELERILERSLQPLLGLLGDLVEELPPDLLQQLLRQGLFLGGGLSRLEGLASYLQHHLALPVHRLEAGERAVVLGLQACLREPQILQSALASASVSGASL